ncbi:CheR family methyltransferase [Nitrospirota bacterium]
MTENTYKSYAHVKLTDKEFSKLSKFIHTEYGIKMPPAKKTMLEARLQKRLKTLDFISFTDYSKYLFSPEGVRDELVHMVDMVTTNKTDFFRESTHFDYLVRQTLPDLHESYNAGYRGPLKIWSAGCSSGEEPYTMAMVLEDYAEAHPGFMYSILGTDISSRMLESARMAIYSEARVEPVSKIMKKRYLLRSKDKKKENVRIVPALRSKVSFQRLNFMDDYYEIRDMMHIIFCRNVIIYFDRPTQEKLLRHLAKHLMKDGYIFMGHSETLSGLDVPFKQVASTVYKKVG